jgi:leucyl aminopeptidase
VELVISAESPDRVEAALLAVCIVEPARLLAAAQELDGALGGRLAHLVADGEIKGRAGHLAVTHALGELPAHRVAAAGLGDLAEIDADSLRTVAARAARRLQSLGGGTVAWALEPELPLTPAEQARAIVDGTVLGSYDPGRWKTESDERGTISRLVLLAGAAKAEIEETAGRARTVAEWANMARDLVNAPANELTPRALAEKAREIAGRFSPVRFRQLDREGIAAAGMGAFSAVARGSTEEPRLIVLEYRPREAAREPVLGLVGKAITFDAGGISLKPAARMDAMKDDMAGGAAVLCGLGAIAELGLPIRALAVVPSCENMPGGSSYRPGDILTSLSGKTIEITNTDAEGRLVLADALTYARRHGATHLLDLATLTSGMTIALGDFYAGLMGGDPGWVETVRQAAEASGDHAWVLPLHRTYRRLYRSSYADMKNSSDLRQAVPVYAAMFLQEFAGEGPWAHLDIAGTAYLDRGRGDYFTGQGATGYGVRLIAELAGKLV